MRYQLHQAANTVGILVPKSAMICEDLHLLDQKGISGQQIVHRSCFRGRIVFCDVQLAIRGLVVSKLWSSSCSAPRRLIFQSVAVFSFTVQPKPPWSLARRPCSQVFAILDCGGHVYASLLPSRSGRMLKVILTRQRRRAGVHDPIRLLVRACCR